MCTHVHCVIILPILCIALSYKILVEGRIMQLKKKSITKYLGNFFILRVGSNTQELSDFFFFKFSPLVNSKTGIRTQGLLLLSAGFCPLLHATSLKPNDPLSIVYKF